MINPLIGLHAGLGELGAMAFLWMLIELLQPTDTRLRRARMAVWIGVTAFLLAWLFGGYYYVVTYGAVIKPIIKAGPLPWTHSVIMETKEHLFLFLPFLAVTVAFAVRHAQKYKPLLMLTGVIILLALSMAAMGFLISSGYRDALEVTAPVI